MILNLKGKEIDLTKIGINFDLNSQQIECLEKITDFVINRSEHSFTLQGYAGTGKSSIVKILLKWFNIYYMFFDSSITAPTHRAKVVIENLSGKESKTLHSILNLRPDVSIENLDARNIIYDNRTKKAESMPKNLLIIDESSMINDFLFDLIIEKTSLINVQVLFIGDSAQIKPVKQSSLSKVFLLKNKYELTKIERQKDENPIGSILFDIRSQDSFKESKMLKETKLNLKNQGIVFLENSSEFLSKAEEDFKESIENKNYFKNRILAFTNNRVELYNKVIRKKLNLTDEINENDLIMSYSTVGDDFLNSCDFIVDSKPVLQEFDFIGVKAQGYDIYLKSTDGKKYINFIVLSDKNSNEIICNIAENIEELRINAIRETNRFKKIEYWKEYYEIMRYFISSFPLMYDNRVIKPKSFSFGFSHTIHKSQGGTYDNIYIDFKDVDNCFDIQLKNQLKYVALSRCRNTAVVLF